MAKTGTTHLASIVADLKTIGRTSKTIENIDLNACIKSAVNILSHQLKRGVSLTVEQSEEPCTVSIIRSQILQILINIIHNAIQAMEEKGKIAITIKQSKELIIEDSGPGISTENIDKIFTTYFTTKKIGTGTGLGLSIAKTILDEHNASISYQKSEKLGGAKFTIKFKK